jgi:hypothetical protein
MVGNTLLELHRHHLGAKLRDVKRERSLAFRAGQSGDVTTRAALVEQLTGGMTGPGTSAGRA